MSTLTLDLIDTIRLRQSAGEKLPDLARELGIPWQRLSKALRGKLAAGRDFGPKGHPETVKRLTRTPGLLVDRYRPSRLADLIGQPTVRKQLGRFIEQPCSCAMMFSGGTGVGKTSAGLALARELGCEIEEQEAGGLYVVSSGDNTADAVRELCKSIWTRPLCGSGWRVVVVNEADKMSGAVETIWLDRLEHLPPKCVVVFTTNHGDSFTDRFRDRCLQIPFDSRADVLRKEVIEFLRRVWRTETGTELSQRKADELLDAATDGKQISIRRALQAMQMNI